LLMDVVVMAGGRFLGSGWVRDVDRSIVAVFCCGDVS